MDLTLNIFTLNCWGIPVVSKNRKERFEAIATYLSQAPHNIVCLQEVWSETDYLYLKEQLQTNLPFSHYFYSGVLGSGLCIFSKWLIQDVFFHQWPLNGYIHKIHHGDWFGGKGLGLCRIKCDNRLINIYCTHLHAEYNVDDIYLAHRVLQAYSTAEFVNLTTPPADVSILAGDLNTAPGDISFRLISQLPQLVDPCILSRCNNVAEKPAGTCDNINNSYSDPKLVKTCPEGKRIDHILFNVHPQLEADVVNFGNPLEERVPGKAFSYSDHNAVYLELKIKQTDKFKHRQQSAEERFQETIDEAIKICKEAMVTITKTKRLFLTTGGLIFMFLLGSVGFWPNNIIADVLKIIMTGICLYYITMGTLWHKIEMNSLKAGLSAMENFKRSRNDVKFYD
ncbi:putative neutral sphingomyelinase [Bicyclus anynana]|uniref:sphingomyelin phosphodiesterase n=1 Tax=Bicyclus anynana TaxID=110368 RepID=A0A6J1MZA4_BICAN|nr:putative neutral sphingomyelinase [Bicyclus anynana]